ncbi:MAG: type II toxin-antitoxin system PemK/MazF family toxin [Nitrospira sp.]|nr:type II toxin-antitoxin system PemK/MazF family toxin [Nitrospira sp.]
MTRLSVICEQWDVVVVPFPFTERPGAKRRPAAVLSKQRFNEHGHTVLLMITTKAHQPWPGDSDIEDHRSAGLHSACLVRLKAFTLDNRLILKRLGALSALDRRHVADEARQHLL